MQWLTQCLHALDVQQSSLSHLRHPPVSHQHHFCIREYHGFPLQVRCSCPGCHIYMHTHANVCMPQHTCSSQKTSGDYPYHSRWRQPLISVLHGCVHQASQPTGFRDPPVLTHLTWEHQNSRFTPPCLALPVFWGLEPGSLHLHGGNLTC